MGKHEGFVNLMHNVAGMVNNVDTKWKMEIIYSLVNKIIVADLKVRDL